MADSATKQSTPTFVGTSKVVETEYPVSFRAIGGSMDRADEGDIAHRQ